MTEFPTIVYKVPGPHRGPGCTYAYLGVDDAAAYKAALATGWHPTILAAKGGEQADKVLDAAEALEAVTNDVSPSARDELEQRAKALGVSFNARTKDEVLIARIAEASA